MSFMRSEKVLRLGVGDDNKISELNGPDQGGVVQKLAEQCKKSTILGIFRALEYDGPPELLSMYLCLAGVGGGVKRKNGEIVRLPALRGDRFLYAGRIFQTRTVFLRDTCGITNGGQP